MRMGAPLFVDSCWCSDGQARDDPRPARPGHGWRRTRLLQSGAWAPTAPPYPGSPGPLGPTVRAGRRRGSAWWCRVGVRSVRCVHRVEVDGESMAPTLLDGDRLVVLPRPCGAPVPTGGGDVVAVPDPRDPVRMLVKRVASVDRVVGHRGGPGRRPRGQHRQPGVRPGAAGVAGRPGRLPVRPRQAAPAPVPGPREYDRPDAEHPGRPQPTPRPDLPRRRRRPVARRHPAHARRVPGGRSVALLPAAPHPGPHGHRPCLPRPPGGLGRPRPVERGRQPRRDPAGPGRPAGPGATPSCTHPTPRRWPG